MSQQGAWSGASTADIADAHKVFVEGNSTGLPPVAFCEHLQLFSNAEEAAHGMREDQMREREEDFLFKKKTNQRKPNEVL